MDSACIPEDRAATRLRIAIVTETYSPEVNGVAMTLARMVAALQVRQHDLQIVRPRQDRDDIATRRPGFEEVLVAGISIPRYDVLKLGLPATRTLVNLWRQNRPDVVHIVTEGPLGWSAVTAAARLGIPATSDFHTNFHAYSGHYGIGLLKRPIAAYLRSFHNRTLCTMVPTEGMRAELEQLGMKNLRVVSRGVDAVLFSPWRRSHALRASWGARDEDLVVVHVGRLAPEKNLPLVLAAFEAMRTANPALRLVLVGDGPERAGLQRRHPHHVFAGMRTGADLAAHYASGDIFLFPSVTETYGNVTMEAMASGLAVIAYHYAAAAEHIRHGANGLLARFDDAAEFVRLAAGCATDRERVLRLGKAARASTERLDWVRVAADFENALHDAILTEASFELAGLSA